MKGNDLGGYDMVACITQDTLNYQFKQLWKPAGLDADKKKIDIEMSDTGVRLTAELDYPLVDLALQGLDKTVLFKLRMKSGSFTYWKDLDQTLNKTQLNLKTGFMHSRLTWIWLQLIGNCI